MSDEPAGSGQGRRRVVSGIVRAQLPSGLYEVDLGGTHRITAHVGGGLQRNFVRLLVGDEVAVEVTPRDPTRGRIVSRS